MIEKSLSELKPLDSFDKEAFIGDDEYSQELCNFILALALIWNDLKNLMVFLETSFREHYHSANTLHDPF